MGRKIWDLSMRKAHSGYAHSSNIKSPWSRMVRKGVLSSKSVKIRIYSGKRKCICKSSVGVSVNGEE